MTSPDRIRRIRAALIETLAPDSIQIEDEGHHHIGHPGARSGGHFHVRIVSGRFTGKPSVERHRMVYAAVGALMQTDIHALRLTTLAPGETSVECGHSHLRGNH